MLDVARTVDVGQDEAQVSATRLRDSTVKRVQTISGVTAEAGAVFEHLLRRSHSDSSSSSTSHRVTRHRATRQPLSAISEVRDSRHYDYESTDHWNTSLTRDSVDTRLSSVDGLDEVDAVPFHGAVHTDSVDLRPRDSTDAYRLEDSVGVRLSTDALEEFNSRQSDRYLPQNSRDSADMLASSGVSGYHTTSVSVELVDDISDADDESRRKEKILKKKKKTVFQRVRERLQATFSRDEDRSRAARKAEKYINANGKTSKRSRFTASFRRKDKKQREGRGSENSSTAPSYPLASSMNSSNDPPGQQRAESGDSRKSRGVFSSLKRRFSTTRVKSSQSQGSASGVTPTSQSGDEANIHPLSKSQEKILSKYTTTDVVTSTDVAQTDVVDGGGHSRPGRHSVRARLELDIQRPLRPAAQTGSDDIIVSAEPAVTSDLEDRVKDWDFIDGDDKGLPPLEHATDRRFSDKSPAEKEELYERIAFQLSSIGDSYGSAVPQSSSAATDSPECSASQGATSSAPATNVNLSWLASQLLQNSAVNYSNFQSVVDEAVRGESGLQQIACMFQLSMAAIEFAGVGTNVATSIKNMTMRYFEQYFAPWVVEQGGWESVVESTDSEVD